jgi:hypothetical protein
VVGQGTRDLREYKGHVFQNVTQEIGIEWGRRRLQTGFLLRKLQERNNLEGPDVEEIGWGKIE